MARVIVELDQAQIAMIQQITGHLESLGNTVDAVYECDEDNAEPVAIMVPAYGARVIALAIALAVKLEQAYNEQHPKAIQVKGQG